jgi:broad specificity phosphatase PhoE
VTLFLVRHGRTVADPAVPEATRELDPAGFDDVWAMRDRLPQGAAWFTAPEPASVATCQLLTEGEVAILAGLRGPGPGETSEAWEERIAGTVAAVLAEEAGRDVVLVGDAAAWIVVAGVAASRLGTPGLIAIDEPLGSGR